MSPRPAAWCLFLLACAGPLPAQEPPQRVVQVVGEVQGDGRYQEVRFPPGVRWLTWAVEVPPDAPALLVIVNAGADVDLFLRRGQPIEDYARDPDHRAVSSQGSEWLLIDGASSPPLEPGRWFLDVTRPADVEVPPFELTVTTSAVPAVAWARRARQERLTGDLTGAARDCERALALDPREDEGWAERAWLLAAQGKRTEAAADWRRVLELAPQRLAGVATVSTGTTFALGLTAGARQRAMFRLQVPVGCRRLAISASDAGSDVDLHLREGVPPDEGRREADHARVSWRRDERLWLETGDAPRPLSPGDWWLVVECGPTREGGRQEVRIAFDPPEDPARDPRWWEDRARMHAAAHQPEGALRALTVAMQLDRDDPHMHLARAEALKELERWRDALAAYDQVLALDSRFPGTSVVLMGRATCARETGDFERALRDLEALERLLPRQAEVPWQRAQVFVRRGQLEPALEQLELALTREPAHWRALLLRAQVRARQGDRDGARQDHDLALRISSSQVLAHEQVDGVLDGGRAATLDLPAGRRRRLYLALVKEETFTLALDLRGADAVQVRLRWSLPPQDGAADLSAVAPGPKRLVLSRDSLPALRTGFWYVELTRDDAGRAVEGAELSLRLLTGPR